MWDHTYGWPDGGDIWSSGWGGPEAQWSEWLQPRLIHATTKLASEADPDSTMDGRRAVEIGCGHGRWTGYLAERFDEVVAVDLSAGCVEATRTRFEGRGNVRVELCDGRALPTIGDRSVDLVFSFDSLVHADAPTVDAYLAECARVLTSSGTAFLHHSNLAATRGKWLRRRRGTAPLLRWLGRLGLVERDVHWRDPTVDADLVVAMAARHRLCVRHQELLRWATRRAAIDCISTIRRAHPGDPPVDRTETTDLIEQMVATRKRRDDRTS